MHVVYNPASKFMDSWCTTIFKNMIFFKKFLLFMYIIISW